SLQQQDARFLPQSQSELMQTAQKCPDATVSHCDSLASAMRCSRFYLAGLSLAIVAGLAAPGVTWPAAGMPLRLVTWNMEWLVDGDTARAARIACRDAQASA